MKITVTCICPDLSQLDEVSLQKLVERHANSDIIVFPEYLLEIAKEPSKSFPSQLIFWGSEIDLGFNKTKVSLNGDFLSYNKQKLTHQEKQLKAGSENICIHYKGVKIGLAVGFDVQSPELTEQWRKDDLDILIVPAATNTHLDYEGISRCASARAVELGCAVITCHLVGKSPHEMMNARVGNHHLYLPAQSLFDQDTRSEDLQPAASGEAIRTFCADIDKIRAQKALKTEINQ